jgi:general secretion pathway protein J
VSTRRQRRGITLIDTMISIAVLVVITSVTAVIMANAVQLNSMMEDYYGPNGSARSGIERMRRDIQLSFLTTNTGDIERYQTVFAGYDESPDSLYFATRSHQRLYRDSRECDQTEITIWAESMPDRGDGYVIYLREAPRIDGEPGQGGRVYPLVYNVKSFELRYLDGAKNEWVDEWDSRKPDFLNRLPRAVEIAMVVYTVDPKDRDDLVEKPHLLQVMLDYADPITQQSGDQEWRQ